MDSISVMHVFVVNLNANKGIFGIDQCTPPDGIMICLCSQFSGNVAAVVEYLENAISKERTVSATLTFNHHIQTALCQGTSFKVTNGNLRG